MNKKIVFVCLLICLCLLQAIAKPAKRIPDIVLGHPIKAIYVDWHLNWNTPQQSILDAVNAGYNVIIISFYLSGGTAADMAQAWAALDDNTKQTTIQQAHSKGAVVTVSLGGSTDSPYQHDAQATGQAVANWAKSQYLDGVDFDLENLIEGFTAGGMSDKDTVAWIAKLTQAAIDGFGGTGVISHAPQGPYFGPIGATNTWTGPTGGYSSVYALVPNITFFNVQFYNQGASCYTDYNGLFLESGTSCPVFPNTSVAEIHYAGIPYNKIVVGKPVTSADASNGWVDGSTLGGYFTKAQQQLGWNAGLMGWVWNDASTCAAFVNAVYPNGGSSSGVSGPSVAAASVSSSSSSSSSGTSTSSSSTSSSSSSGTSGGGCNGATSGMVCADKTHFYFCPSGPTEACGSGTVCIDQGGNPPSIQCGWPSHF